MRTAESSLREPSAVDIDELPHDEWHADVEKRLRAQAADPARRLRVP